MPMDSNDNKTVGLPPNMANGLRKVARPGGAEPPAAAKAPAAPPPRPERKAPPERKIPPERPAAPPAPARPGPKPPVGPDAAAGRPPENPWMETVLPPPGGLWKGQAQARGQDPAEDSSWWPGGELQIPPSLAEPPREIPAVVEPRPEPRRLPPTPVKSPPPVRDMPGTQTIAIPGKGLDPELLAEGKSIVIKVFTKGAAWLPLTSIRVNAEGQVIGRSMPDASGPAYSSLAPDHFRLSWTDGRLQIQEVKTINGVYIRLAHHCKVPLTDGSRFMIGPHVLEFRKHVDTDSANQPAIGPDGEVFRSVAVKPLAYLDILGPNARPSLRVPLTKPDFTDIGRYGGDKSDVVLSDDGLISRQHARIHHKDGEFFLEDLQSSNGTFVKIRGKRTLNLGTSQNEGLSDQVLAGELFLRFIEI